MAPVPRRAGPDGWTRVRRSRSGSPRREDSHSHPMMTKDALPTWHLVAPSIFGRSTSSRRPPLKGCLPKPTRAKVTACCVSDTSSGDSPGPERGTAAWPSTTTRILKIGLRELFAASHSSGTGRTVCRTANWPDPGWLIQVE